MCFVADRWCKSIWFAPLLALPLILLVDLWSTCHIWYCKLPAWKSRGWPRPTAQLNFSISGVSCSPTCKTVGVGEMLSIYCTQYNVQITIGPSNAVLLHFGSNITMVEAAKYSIIILMCQLIIEIDRCSFILQACHPHKINAELITVSGQCHFCGIFGTLKDIKQKDYLVPSVSVKVSPKEWFRCM